MGGSSACGRVEVCDGRGREVGVWGEEEGALKFGRGGDGILEGPRYTLGEEKVTLR